MSAEDNPPAGQADIGEALVAALGFEPTEGIKQGRKGSTATSGDGGPGGQANRSNAGQRRSKKSRRKNRSGGGASGRARPSSGNGDTAEFDVASSGPPTPTELAGDDQAAVDEAVVQGVKSALDDIKSAAKPAVSDRSKIIVGGAEDDLEDGWVSVEARADDGSTNGDSDDGDTIGVGVAGTVDGQADAKIDGSVDGQADGNADSTVDGTNDTDGSTGDAAPDGMVTDATQTAEISAADVDLTTSEPRSDADGSDDGVDGAAGSSTDSTVEIVADDAATVDGDDAGPSAADADGPEGSDHSGSSDDETVFGGPPPGAAVPAGAAEPAPSALAHAAMADTVAVTGELDRLTVDEALAEAGLAPAATTSTPAPPGPSVPAVAAEMAPGMEVPSSPPIVGEAPSNRAPELDRPGAHPAHTGEVTRVETRDDEIQAARLEAESRARESGREVFRRGSWINLFRRSRRLQSRKVRRVVRHVDPWSVLTFSVLFHLCVFAALLLASVLVWNAAEAAGTIEDLEGFILELGDYETFEIKGDVVFRAAVAIAGILTLASSVLLVLLTVVFNLISDLVGGIRMTVIEEETVRVRRRKAQPEVDVTAG
ncbi:MAG: DUF3566 domain-containing protein [Actinomycetota bacterium]